MKTPKSFYSRLADFLAPRQCLQCGRRLDPAERFLCTSCNLWLPRTGYAEKPFDNPMAQLFYIRTSIVRAAALFFYQSHAPVSALVYALKYRNRPAIGREFGLMAATEMQPYDFFQGIDLIVPVPLARRRERERGYNQSLEIARGVAQLTHISIAAGAVCRTRETLSQTLMNHDQRLNNVEGAFTLTDARQVQGRHVLIVDDIVTSGATVCALARELMKAGGVSISVLSLGFTKS